MKPVTWSYGVTTVKERFNTLLPKTLASLAVGGFNQPHIFVDGPEGLALPYTITYRPSRIRTFGNWTLGLWELFLRDPTAMFYAMFQDDFVIYKNARQYLEKTCTTLDGAQNPEALPKLYWNLYTYPARPPKGNQHHCPRDATGCYIKGWYRSNQCGHGAVALIFSRQGVIDLLTHQHMVERPQDTTWGHKKIDGGICEAYRKAGYEERVHFPSIVQHMGEVSSMENAPHPRAENYLGEKYDAMDFLRC